MQAADEDIARAHIMMRGHDEMRQLGLAAARSDERGIFVYDAVGPECGEQIELRVARAGGTPVGEVDDLALARPVDGAVRLFDKARQTFRMPVIAARLALVAVHALLHHRPLAVIGDEEAVQVEIEAVLHGGAVDLGHKAAGAREGRASKPMRSPSAASSSGVRRECLPRPPQT